MINNQDDEAHATGNSGQEPQPAKDERREAQPTQAERNAALFGPQGLGEYKEGDMITFRVPLSREILTGKVLWVRAPAPAVAGGKVHSLLYWCYVKGESLPRVVFPKNIIQQE